MATSRVSVPSSCICDDWVHHVATTNQLPVCYASHLIRWMNVCASTSLNSCTSTYITYIYIIIHVANTCTSFTAGLVAAQMGLPLRFTCAVNKNDIVARTFSSGDFSTSHDVEQSLAPAMDIQARVFSFNLMKKIPFLKNVLNCVSFQFTYHFLNS